MTDDAGERNPDPLRRRVGLVLSGSIFLLLAHAFVPLEQFVQRSDDAFYYFKVAANYPTLGFWSFDGIHATNGVQPLWAVILSAAAELLSRLGITDPDPLARAFVALAALMHFAASMLLFHLLAKKVSTGTAAVAAGAFLLPMGIVWSRLWGVESGLYALTLTASVSYFHLVYRQRETSSAAFVLGLLLGVTALARLNACLFVPCVLLALLRAGRDRPFRGRLRLAAVVGLTASLVVSPYFLGNYRATGHVMPVSGVVKDLAAERYLAAKGVESRFSSAFLSAVYDSAVTPVSRFVTSRAADALWIGGSRLVHDGPVSAATIGGILTAFALWPLLFGEPREWLRFLRGRFSRLTGFGYVAAFGLIDVTLTLLLHPDQVRYAAIRWWWVENEIIVVVVVATLVAAAISYTVSRLRTTYPLREWFVPALLALLVTLHTVQMARFYWSGRIVRRPWSLSWNDESYRAAQWMAEHLPPDAKVGAWNAGVLGYYGKQTVVNLDGLINDFELLPYLRQRQISEYILNERITYLSDLAPTLETHGVKRSLELTEVYRHYSRFMRRHYVVYRVEGGKGV